MHGNFRLVMALCAGTVLGASALRVVQAQSSPPAYAVIQSTIIDQDAFRQFLPQIGAVIAAHNGKFFARGGRIDTLFGAAPLTNVAVIQFASMKDARAWADSSEYQKLIPLRDKAVSGPRAFAVEGL